jgi:hypothetical protein
MFIALQPPGNIRVTPRLYRAIEELQIERAGRWE